MATRAEEVLVKLRKMIVTQEIMPGSRVPERDLAELFGVSRTPVRVALGILEAEGLVSGEPNCGFIVNAFGIDEVLSAYDVRGVLEGLAARTAVERGVGADVIEILEECVAEGQRLVAAGTMGDDEMRRWSSANDKFHRTLIEAAGLPALSKAHAFISRMPMAAPIAIMFTGEDRGGSHSRMTEAHDDHVHVLAAIRRGEGARAEYLMREHAQRSRDNLSIELHRRLAQRNPKAAAKGRRSKAAEANAD